MSYLRRPEHPDGKVAKLLAPSQPKPPSLWKTLPIFVPFAGSALYFTWARLSQSGALSEIVSSTAGAYFHTGSRLLDRFILANVRFYQQALDPSNPPFFPGDVSSIAACAAIPLIESLRTHTPKQIQYPLVTGLAAQTLGRGAIYPLYWASFISSGAARKRPSESVGTAIHQYDAEGALLASFVGFVLPGLGMSITKSSHWTLAWFIYPITLTIISKVYSTLRRWLTPYHPPYEVSSKRSYQILQATYLLQFLYATSLHIKVLGPRIFHLDALKRLLHVEIPIPSLATTPMHKIVYQVVQWDSLFLYSSSLIATLGFARTKTEAIGIAAFDLLATAACGTGGALAGIWAWREHRLHKERPVYQEVMRGV